MTAPRLSQQERNELVERNLPAARGCYRRFMKSMPTHFDDGESLLQACYEGLAQAAASYDPARASFVGHAWPRMWGAMQDELRRIDWLPRSLRARIRALEKTVAKLEQTLDHQPTVDEICAAHGIDRDEYHELVTGRSHGNVTSLQVRAIGEGFRPDDASELLDSVADGHDAYERSELLSTFRECWAQLTDRERFVLVEKIVNERPGLEVAGELGVSESRVSQIGQGAAAKLRRMHRAA